MTKFWQNSTEIGRHRPKFGRSGPNLVDLGRNQVRVGQVRPSLFQIDQISTKFRPMLAEFGHSLAKFGSNRPKLFPNWPSLADFGPNPGSLGNFSTTSAQLFDNCGGRRARRRKLSRAHGEQVFRNFPETLLSLPFSASPGGAVVTTFGGKQRLEPQRTPSTPAILRLPGEMCIEHHALCARNLPRGEAQQPACPTNAPTDNPRLNHCVVPTQRRVS